LSAHEVGYSGGKTKTGDVDEETVSRLTGEGPIGETTHVHFTSVSGEYCGEGRANAPSEAQGAAKIPAGAAGNHGESGLVREAFLLVEEAVYDLVQRAIATHADDQVAPFPESISNQRRGM
jgi:hypothetical protein